MKYMFLIKTYISLNDVKAILSEVIFKESNREAKKLLEIEENNVYRFKNAAMYHFSCFLKLKKIIRNKEFVVHIESHREVYISDIS